MRRQSSPLLQSRLLALILGFSLFSPLAMGEQVNVNPIAYGYAWDGGDGGLIDGTFADMTVGGRVITNKYRSLDFTTSLERRGAYEFAIPAVLSQPGVEVTSAVLYLPVVSATSQGDTLSVYGYVGNGAMNLGDFAFNGSALGSATIYSGSTTPFQFDVTSYVGARAPYGGYVGFVLGVSWWDAWVESSPGAQLRISYTVGPVNTPPTVAVLSPSSGATVLLGDTVTLQGSASDAEDGDLGEGIAWFSSLDGALGSGGQASVTLSAGIHTITATVVDSAGASGSSNITVQVVGAVNAAPQVTILSPAHNAEFGAGTTISMTGNATDPEDGGLSAQIVWLADGSVTLGTGASASVTLAPGTHTLTAQVTDSAGAVGAKSISVVVLPPVPSYCSARGTSATYEWVNALTLGNYSNVSGKNSGYADFTAGSSINVTTGNNSISLSLGFLSGSYTEYWKIWIDLNRDMVFGSDEVAFSGSGSTALAGILSIPAGTVPGTTRMRVAMKYGSAPGPCESFSYGEVEDYTVSIAEGSGTVPVTYCSLKGSSASYEWINAITVGNLTKASGNNSGYANFTNDAPTSLARGTNHVISLSPGFASSSYAEYWRIWIDYNQDGTFGTNELAFDGSGTSTVVGNLNVPTSSQTGNTRMRVAMKYGSAPAACGSFTYGEAEDYTVLIAP